MNAGATAPDDLSERTKQLQAVGCLARRHPPDALPMTGELFIVARAKQTRQTTRTRGKGAK